MELILTNLIKEKCNKVPFTKKMHHLTKFLGAVFTYSNFGAVLILHGSSVSVRV